MSGIGLLSGHAGQIVAHKAVPVGSVPVNTDSLATPDTYQPIGSSLLILSKQTPHLVIPPPQAEYPHAGSKYPSVLPDGPSWG